MILEGVFYILEINKTKNNIRIGGVVLNDIHKNDKLIFAEELDTDLHHNYADKNDRITIDKKIVTYSIDVDNIVFYNVYVDYLEAGMSAIIECEYNEFIRTGMILYRYYKDSYEL